MPRFNALWTLILATLSLYQSLYSQGIGDPVLGIESLEKVYEIVPKKNKNKQRRKRKNPPE
jgi:hypothetical protein